MLQALLVTFREGLEAFLIVAVIAGYLKKTGRPALLRGLRAGLVASVGTCLAAAWLWDQVPNQSQYEGLAALAAAALVGALLWQMLRVGRHLKGQIEARVERAAEADGASWKAAAGVALVTTLLITREGFEAVLYLGVQARSTAPQPVAIGAAVGLVLAATIAVVWTRWSRALNLGVVLRVTAVFLAIFLLQLVIYGVHEIAESGIIENSQAFHDATEPFGPDGPIGHVLSYSLVVAPLLYLLWSRRAADARRPPGVKGDGPGEAAPLRAPEVATLRSPEVATSSTAS